MVTGGSGNVVSVAHGYYVFEGFVIDGLFGAGRAVEIETAGRGAVLRDLEIKNAGRNCVDMDSPPSVLIEKSEIHHCLFDDPGTAGPDDASLCEYVEQGNIVVLRSFGKFYGLPGIRLSFALAAPNIAARLAAALGPWPLSGTAIALGTEALADIAWREAARNALAEAARRLDALLVRAGLAPIGGTSLFRLVRTAEAARWFKSLGEAGILVRRFDEHPAWLRFGLPGAESEWQRLERALVP